MSIDQQTLLAVTNAAVNLTFPILIRFFQGASAAGAGKGESADGAGKGEIVAAQRGKGKGEGGKEGW